MADLWFLWKNGVMTPEDQAAAGAAFVEDGRYLLSVVDQDVPQPDPDPEPDPEPDPQPDPQPDGSRVTLAAPLAHDHPKASDGDENTYRPHVGNLTRNITIRSENPQGARGHVLFAHRARVDVRYVALRDMGRTTVEAIDFNVPSANQKARYSLHGHHLIGPAQPLPSGYQFNLIGNAVHGGLRWGIVVHGSHYGLVQDNVVYDVAGAAIVTEDGSETGNAFIHNLALRSDGSGQGVTARNELFDNGHSGTNFWFRGQRNYITGNVAANAHFSGFMIFSRFGNTGKSGPVNVPLYQGADPSMEGQFEVLDARATWPFDFSGNEAYAINNAGFEFWYARVTELRNSTAWNCGNDALFFQYQDYAAVDGFRAYDAAGGCRGVRIAHQAGMDLANADIRGMAVGFLGQPGAEGFTIRDSYFENDTDVLLPNGTQSNQWKPVEINNTMLAGRVAINREHGHVRKVNLGRLDQLFVSAYQGVAGDDFEVFYQWQDPDFVMPMTGSKYFDPFTNSEQTVRGGSPVEGLTNRQNWEQYGVAMAGRVATCVDASRPEILGLACPGVHEPALTMTVNIAPGQTLSGQAQVTAAVSPGSGGTVRFSVDSDKLAIDRGAPYDAIIDTTLLSNGTHYLTARYTDGSGFGRLVIVPFIVEN